MNTRIYRSPDDAGGAGISGGTVSSGGTDSTTTSGGSGAGTSGGVDSSTTLNGAAASQPAGFMVSANTDRPPPYSAPPADHPAALHARALRSHADFVGALAEQGPSIGLGGRIIELAKLAVKDMEAAAEGIEHWLTGKTI